MQLLSSTTPAILLKLGVWTPDEDLELPRQGFGYRPGAEERELYDSARAWWHLDRQRVERYAFAVAVFEGVTRGVWQIDHSRWREATLATRERLGSSRRWAFEGVAPIQAIIDEFVGTSGRQVPHLRPDGRAVFGSGGVVSYWPA